MKLKIKLNKILIIFILILCFIFASSPLTYSQSCLKGLSVWATKIFPVMFPFFVFCRIIVELSENKSSFLDKFFNKLYNTPNQTARTFFLASLSGYPMGAKLICDLYENNQISSTDAQKMMSFCSVSGPMFMFGTVGVSIFCSYKSGLIILISNIIASLLNGLIYRGKPTNFTDQVVQKKSSENVISDSVYNSLISILMVGAYIILSFLIVDILFDFTLFWNGVYSVFKWLKISDFFEVFKSVVCGIFEITCGIINLNNCLISLKLKTIISSTLIGFGGFCIMLQNTHFLTKLGLKKRIILLQKLTQGILCFLISVPISILFL